MGAGGSSEGGVKKTNGCEFSNANGSSQRSHSGPRLKQTKTTKPRQSNGGGSVNGGKSSSGSSRRRNEETGTKRRPEAPGFASNAIKTKTTPKPGKTGKGGGAGTAGDGSHHTASGGVSERGVSGNFRKRLMTPRGSPSTKDTTTTKRRKTGNGGEASSVGGGSYATCSGSSGQHAYRGGIGRAPMVPESTSSPEKVEKTVKSDKAITGGGADTVGGASRDSGRGGGGERAYSVGGRTPPVTPGFPSNTHKIKASRSVKQGKTGKGGEAGTVGGGSSSRPSMTPGFASSTDNPETTMKQGKSVKGGEAGTVRGGSHGGGKGGSHSGRNRDEETGTKPPPETHSDDTSSGGSGERANRVIYHKQRVSRGFPSNVNEAKIITNQDGGGGGNGSGSDTEDEFSRLQNNRGAGGGGEKQASGPGGGSRNKSDMEIDGDSDFISEDDSDIDIRRNGSVGGRAEGFLPPNRAATPQVGPEVTAGVAFKPMSSEATLARAAKEQGGRVDGAGGRGLGASAGAAVGGGGGGGGGGAAAAAAAAAAASAGSPGTRATRGERDELSRVDSDGAVDGRRQSDQGNSGGGRASSERVDVIGLVRKLPAGVEVFNLTRGK